MLDVPGDEPAPGSEEDLVLLGVRAVGGEEFAGQAAGVGAGVSGAVAGQAAQAQVGAFVGEGAAGRPDGRVDRVGRLLGGGEEGRSGG